MGRVWAGFGTVITIALFSLALSSCRTEPLQELERFFITAPVESGVEVNFCTDPAQEVRSRLKYIVVLDHSGSNVENYLIDPTTGGPDLSSGVIDIRREFGTDPERTARYGDPAIEGTLLNFLTNQPPNDPTDPSVYFALLMFTRNISSYPSNLSGFTSNIPAFASQVASIKQNSADQGATNYLDTLRSVQTLIQNDINLARQCGLMSAGSTPTTQCPRPGVHVSSSYVIVFMSDGAPIISIDVSQNPIAIDRQSSREILATVAGIVGLQSNTRYVDSVNLFTIYYHHPVNIDLSAQKLLEDMAVVGNGVSYNITSGSNIDYRRFTTPKKLIKFTLADIFVTNASVVVGPDGAPLADTDMDGIADETEIVLGSDPYNRDSDGNGVSDFVEMHLNGTPCADKNSSGLCRRGASTINYRASAFCPTVPVSNISVSAPARPISGAIAFANSDPNGLNDCEKIILNNTGGISNPDSNGDLIPDWLQFKNGVPFQLGISTAHEFLDADTMSFYQKIKRSLPAQIPYYRLLYPKPVRYDLTLLNSSAVQDCYRLRVDDLPIVGSDNMVRVDAILRSPLLQDRYLYRRGMKRFDGERQTLRFNDWNDLEEQGAGTWRSWP